MRIFHVGGELDFDNGFRWLAPWRCLDSGKISVIPAVRRFRGRRWSRIAHEPLRLRPDLPADRTRIAELIQTFESDLSGMPLYVSLDKDVLTSEEATVNWDSGFLQAAEALEVIRAFVKAARGNIAGMDVVGDWSPVRVSGLFRHAMHWVEHPRLPSEPARAADLNERCNLAVMRALRSWGLEDHHRGFKVRAA
jgi:hypothetical protein